MDQGPGTSAFAEPDSARRDFSRRSEADPNPSWPLTPHVVCSWSCRLDDPALPVTGIRASRVRRAEANRDEASCAREPFTSPPGFRSRSPKTQRACFREARRRRDLLAQSPSAEGRFLRPSAKKSAICCTQGAFHRGTPDRLGDGFTRFYPRRPSLDRVVGRLSTGCAQPVEIAPTPFQPRLVSPS